MPVISSFAPHSQDGAHLCSKSIPRQVARINGQLLRHHLAQRHRAHQSHRGTVTPSPLRWPCRTDAPLACPHLNVSVPMGFIKSCFVYIIINSHRGGRFAIYRFGCIAPVLTTPLYHKYPEIALNILHHKWHMQYVGHWLLSLHMWRAAVKSSNKMVFLC